MLPKIVSRPDQAISIGTLVYQSVSQYEHVHHFHRTGPLPVVTMGNRNRVTYYVCCDCGHGLQTYSMNPFCSNCGHQACSYCTYVQR